ncbi:retrovirus-related pol polyprotein from transposon TNT 1-94 [Tanacetum coccineum]
MQLQNVGNQLFKMQFRIRVFRILEIRMGKLVLRILGNGNVVAARAEGNATGNNGNQIRCYNCRGLGHLARNCTVRPRRRDAAYLQTQLLIAPKGRSQEGGIKLQDEEASTSGTQTDKAPVYDSDGSAEVHNYDNCYDNEIFNMFTQEEQYIEILEPIPEPHHSTTGNDNVISDSGCGTRGGRVDNTAKTKRPQPRSNTKNDRIPSESKSSCIKNKEVEVEEHHRNLLLSKNKKHMSSECKHVKPDIRYDKSEVICAMCKQCLFTANHDVCMLNYVKDMNSRGKKQKANVSNTANQKKQKPKIWTGNPKASTQCRLDVFGNRSLLENVMLLQFWVLGVIFNGGNIFDHQVYFVGALGHNMFSVWARFCDSDLEVAFRRNSCFVRTLEGVDLLKENRSTNLYSINLHEMASASPICLMA